MTATLRSVVGSRQGLSAAVIGVAALLSGAAQGAVVSAIDAAFNSEDIAAGRTIWFSSVFIASPGVSSPANIFLRNSTITFSDGGNDYTVTVPDSTVTLFPAVFPAIAQYGGSNDWTVQAMPSLGNSFLTGAAFTVPVDGISGGSTVHWEAEFTTDSPGLTLDWKWGAAVYAFFTNELSGVGVKPVDGNTGSVYANLDLAGTPQNYRGFVVAGATGGGGTNYTGTYSTIGSVSPSAVPAPGVVGLVLGALPLAMMRRRRA